MRPHTRQQQVLIPRVVAMSTVGAFVASTALAGDLEATWIGPPEGIWSAPGNWSTGTVPLNGAQTYVVLIDGGTRRSSFVTLDLNATVSGLVVDANDLLKVKNGRTLGIDASILDLHGTIEVASVGLPTRVLAWRDLLQTGGVIALGSSAQNRIESFPGKRWTLAEGAVIQGSGTFAPGMLSNHGLIEATAGNGLVLSALAASENQGTMRAVGSLLQLTCGTLSGPGAIVAGAGGTVQLKAGALSLQTFEAVEDGSMQIQPGSSGFITLTNATVEGLATQLNGTVNLGTTLTLGGGAEYRVAANAKLFFEPPNVTLAAPAGGSVQLMGSGTTVSSSSTATVLTIAPGCTLRGVGQSQSISILQQGTIRADGVGTLAIGSGTFDNQGLLEATTGTLSFFGSTISNTGQIRAVGTGVFRVASSPLDNAGTIEAVDGGTVRIAAGATLRHGLVDASDGTFLVGDTGTAPVLEGLSVLGDVTVETGTSAVIQGSQSFLDRVVLRPNASLLVKGAFTLLGDGFDGVRMGQASTLAPADGTSSLLLAFGSTIDGEGTITCPLTVFGEVRGTEGVGITVTAPVANNGVLSSVNAPLTLKADVTNGGTATIRRESGELLTLIDCKISGGMLESLGEGAIDTNVSTPSANVTLSSLAIHGPLIARAGLILSGTIVNAGVITVQGDEGLSSIAVSVSPNVTLSGTGELVLAPGSHVSLRGGGALVNGPTHTIRGEGALGAGTLAITNAGTVHSEAGGFLIQPPTSGFTNSGTLSAVDGDVIILGGTFVQSGTIEVGPERLFFRDQALTQTSGSLKVNGTLMLGSGALTIAGGAIRGGGSVVAPLVVNAALVDPDASDGSKSGSDFGTLSALSLTMSSLSTTRLDIGGAGAGQHDAIDVTETAKLDGHLELAFDPDSPMAIGTSIVLLQAGGGFTGNFASISSNVPVSLMFGEEFVAAVVQGGLSNGADLDGDGTIGPGDLATLLGAWGPCVEAPCVADLDDDGSVGASDLAVLLGMWPQ
ncbi:MAG: hypothetical protein JNL80_03880 [Phycisphaerae bacterium]|jgi:hypothetical protein|nr:hypothetical protein [Phycisphaerae bacterium]